MEHLYVKRLPNGLLYLGKTRAKDPYRYLGSGKIWLRTIKKYGYTHRDIETWILDTVKTSQEVRQLGQYYSNLFNVVESEKWANLKLEEGDGSARMLGNDNPSKRSEVREKIRQSKLGVRRPDMVGNNNPSKRPEVREKLTKVWTSDRRKKQATARSGENHPLARAVEQYTLQGEFVAKYGTVAEANIATRSKNVGAVLTGKIKSSMGYKWKYSTD